MNEYLKPCPCCGGKNIVAVRLSASRNDDLTNVLCAPKDGGCGLCISRPNYTDAIAAWNFRTPVSEPGPRPATTADPRVDDLSILVKQLVHSLRKAAPENALAERALDYLRRKDMLGTPMRVEGGGVLKSDVVTANMEAA